MSREILGKKASLKLTWNQQAGPNVLIKTEIEKKAGKIGWVGIFCGN